jgi:type IV secretory pathway VirB10-like protein
MSDDLPEQETGNDADDRDDARFGRRTTLLIVAAAVVVLAAIGVGIYLIAASGDTDVADPAPPTITESSQPEPPPSSEEVSGLPTPSSAEGTVSKAPKPSGNRNVVAARSTAEQAAQAINARDIDAMKQLSCDPSTVGSVEAFPPEATARLVENPQIEGNKATAQIELSIAGSEPTLVPLPMERHNGKWCVP